jgi:hypothetical protein
MSEFFSDNQNSTSWMYTSIIINSAGIAGSYQRVCSCIFRNCCWLGIKMYKIILVGQIGENYRRIAHLMIKAHNLA